MALDGTRKVVLLTVLLGGVSLAIFSSLGQRPVHVVIKRRDGAWDTAAKKGGPAHEGSAAGGAAGNGGKKGALVSDVSAGAAQPGGGHGTPAPPRPDPHTRSYDGEETAGENDGGRWWHRGEAGTGDPPVVVVLGGLSREDDWLHQELTRYGFVVWRPKDINYCLRPTAKRLQTSNCDDHWGFVEYLANEEPATPRAAQHTVFLSAQRVHAGISKKGGGIEGVVAAIDAALAQQVYAALPWAAAEDSAPAGTTLPDTLSDVLGEHRGLLAHDRAGPLLAAAAPRLCFTLPRAVQRRYAHGAYLSLLQYLLHDPRSRSVQYPRLFAAMFSEELSQGFAPVPGDILPPPSPTATVTFHSNDAGYWTAPRRGAEDATLVVVGGSTDDCSPLLSRAGHAVWKSRSRCGKGGRCRENWGYIKYLADEDSEKPRNKAVAFVHGHSESGRHQRAVPLEELIKDAAACALRTERFTSIYRVINFRAGIHASSVLRTFNDVFGEWRRVPDSEMQVENHFCCAQFVLPRARIEANPAALYRKMDAFHNDPRCHGIYYELIWHLFFKESVSVDVSENQCEPTPPDNFLAAHLEAVPDLHIESNRIGLWTPRHSTAHKDVIVVSGADYNNWYEYRDRPGEESISLHVQREKFVKGILKADYDLWVRRPLVGRHKGARHDARGYLAYITDFTRAAQYGRKHVVFLRGDEEVTPELLAAVQAAVDKVRAARESGGELFAYIRWKGESVLDEPISRVSGPNGWNGMNCAAFCNNGKIPSEPSDIKAMLGEVKGAHFVVGAEVFKDRHPQCLTEALVTADFDYEQKYMNMYHYFWRLMLGRVPKGAWPQPVAAAH